MIKKISLFILLSFLLFSCWEDIVDQWGTWVENFENKDFSMLIPSSWQIIENDDKVLPKPKDWEISLAVSSTDISYWFSNNLLILKQDLDKTVSSKDFSVINYVWATWEYNDYVKLDSTELELSSWDKTIAYTFEAKYNESTPKLKFVQTSVVCWKTWYLLTIALSLDIKDTDKYIDLFKTFTCK